MIQDIIKSRSISQRRTLKPHDLLAWQNSNLVDWDPLSLGSFKVNFDVAIRPTFAVAAAVLQDHSEKFLAVNTLKLPPIDALMGEAHAALLASKLAVSMGCSPLIIEGDSLLTILALKDHLLFSDRIFAPVIFDSFVQLHSINV
jgi:hypothetical protein